MKVFLVSKKAKNIEVNGMEYEIQIQRAYGNL